ncbi:MAG TPA: FliM/FliN family flagellar motor switch protein [Polyangiaceae bacterium]|jgi:flagellar motor switch/type III secretory pathway protein FliN
MSPRAATAYPWKALEMATRDGARRAAEARRQVQRALDTTRLAHALSEICACEASIIVRRVNTSAPRRRPSTELGFELGGSGIKCALYLEPELIVSVLALTLQRPVRIAARGALDESLEGAFSAIVAEVARRSGTHGALHALGSSDNIDDARDVFVEATALIAGKSYEVIAALALPTLPPVPEATLGALGELPIAVPLVVGLGLAERSALADFSLGNAWFPGAGFWLDRELEGPIALSAGTRDQGVAGTLSRDGRIVIRGESVALPFDYVPAHAAGKGEAMSDSEKPEPSTLTEAVLDSPIVVRIEIGAVSMSAREWAELGPGDIIETGRRIAEPVALRVGGREVARGELVNLEGELGVRIRELIRS